MKKNTLYRFARMSLVLLIASVIGCTRESPESTLFEDLSQLSQNIPPRLQFAFIGDVKGEQLYLFGGDGNTTGDPYVGILNDLWQFDVKAQNWTKLMGQNDGSLFPSFPLPSIPPLVEPHLAVGSDGQLYEYGGIKTYREDKLENFSGHVYRFDAIKGEWQNLTIGNAPNTLPSPREDHGVASDYSHDKIYVFGGESVDPGTGSIVFLNDFWVFDIRTRTWQDLTQSSGAFRIPARSHYTMVYDHKNYLYFFGGVLGSMEDIKTGNVRWANDFWRYDIQNNRWEELTAKTGAERIPPRTYNGLVADSQGHLYMYGGHGGYPVSEKILGDFWIYDAGQQQWIDTTKYIISTLWKRISYSMAYSALDDSIYIFSGPKLHPDDTGKNKRFPQDFGVEPDFYRLDLKILRRLIQQKK